MGLSVVGVDAEDLAAGAAGRNGGFLLAGLADFYHESVKSSGREFSYSTYKESM